MIGGVQFSLEPFPVVAVVAFVAVVVGPLQPSLVLPGVVAWRTVN